MTKPTGGESPPERDDAAMLKLVTNPNDPTPQILDELARQGARTMIARALVLEASEYVERNQDLRDEDGRRLVVKNGVGAARSVTVGERDV